MKKPQKPIDLPGGGKKEVVGMFQSGLKFSMGTGKIYRESAQITTEQQGDKTITEIHYKKTDLYDVYKEMKLPQKKIENKPSEELPDLDPDEIIINGKPW